MSELTGRRLLVTGGNRGIGRAIARELLARGAAVAIVARDRGALASVREELSALGPIHVIAGDVTDGAQVAAAVLASADRLGGIDGVVNSAGMGPRAASFSQLGDEDFRSSFEVNVLGAARVLRAALPELRRHRDSAVVNVASMAGKLGVPMWTEYCTAKHALLGFTKAFAREHAAEGLRCNAVCPGFAEGGLLSDDFLERWADSLGLERRTLVSDVIKKRTPSGRLVGLAAIAATVAFLLGPGAVDITGQALNVCGGIGDY